MRPNGKPITNRRLAMMLRPFEAYPKHEASGNAYTRGHLEDAIERYLPSNTPSSDPPLPENERFKGPQTLGGVGETDDFKGSSEQSDEPLKDDIPPTESGASEGMKLQNAENGMGGGETQISDNPDPIQSVESPPAKEPDDEVF